MVQLVLQYRDYQRATQRLGGIPELLNKLRRVCTVNSQSTSVLVYLSVSTDFIIGVPNLYSSQDPWQREKEILPNLPSLRILLESPFLSETLVVFVLIKSHNPLSGYFFHRAPALSPSLLCGHRTIAI